MNLYKLEYVDGSSFINLKELILCYPKLFGDSTNVNPEAMAIIGLVTLLNKWVN